MSVLLSKELQKRGYDSHVYLLTQHPFFQVEQTSRLGLFFKMMRASIVHFHGRWKEKPILIDSKKIVFHYHGDDLRYVRKMRPHRDGVLHFVSTPDLLCPGVEWLPNPIDLNDRSPIRSENPEPYIIHYPDTKFRMDSKGTPEIRKKISQLEKQGYKFRYVEISNVRHSDMLKELQKCDIFIDQTRPGIYGQAALEALASGKPVIAHPKLDWYPFKDDPFFRIEDLPSLISDPSLRMSKKGTGIEYVSRVHNLKVVTDTLLKRYQEAGLAP